MVEATAEKEVSLDHVIETKNSTSKDKDKRPEPGQPQSIQDD